MLLVLPILFSACGGHRVWLRSLMGSARHLLKKKIMEGHVGRNGSNFQRCNDVYISLKAICCSSAHMCSHHVFMFVFLMNCELNYCRSQWSISADLNPWINPFHVSCDGNCLYFCWQGSLIVNTAALWRWSALSSGCSRSRSSPLSTVAAGRAEELWRRSLVNGSWKLKLSANYRSKTAVNDHCCFCCSSDILMSLILSLPWISEL